MRVRTFPINRETPEKTGTRKFRAETQLDAKNQIVTFLALMKLFLRLLAVFCVIAGLEARVLAEDSCDAEVKTHAIAHAVAGADYDPHHSHDEPCDSSQDRECPLDHSHQPGACSHSLPFLGTEISPGGFAPVSFSLTLIDGESVIPPDAPLLEADKPPLV